MIDDNLIDDIVKKLNKKGRVWQDFTNNFTDYWNFTPHVSAGMQCEAPILQAKYHVIII